MTPEHIPKGRGRPLENAQRRRCAIRKRRRSLMYRFLLSVVVVCLVCTVGYADITAGLVAHYPLDGNANDASGNGHHGTPHGATFAGSPYGQAASFDGNNDYIEIPAHADLSLTQFTLACWCKGTGLSANRVLLKHGEALDDRSNFTLSFHWKRPKRPQVSYESSSDANYHCYANATIEDNTWHFIVGTRNSAGYLRIYIDGELDNTEQYSAPPAQINFPVTIGAGYQDGTTIQSFFAGLIDEVRIYNRALSESEIEELYGQEPEPKILTDLAISGDATIPEGGNRAYTCTAHFSDGTSSNVTSMVTEKRNWLLVQGPSDAVLADNILYTPNVETDRFARIRARYSYGSITKRAYFSVTIEPILQVDIAATSESGHFGVGITITLTGHVTGAKSDLITYEWAYYRVHDVSHGDTNSNPTTCSYLFEGTDLITLRVFDGYSWATNHSYLAIDKSPEPGEPLTTPAVDINPEDSLPSPLDPTQKTNGLVVLTHGLRSTGSDQWILDMESAIELRLSNTPPNVVRWNWEKMAYPSIFALPGLKEAAESAAEVAIRRMGVDIPPEWIDATVVEIAVDILLIRPYAQASGTVLLNWIDEQAYDLGNIDVDAPVHMIGHSAGGFVTGECALNGSASLFDQVTMLDTPFPLRNHFTRYPDPGHVERYVSSFWGHLAPQLIGVGTDPFYYRYDLDGSWGNFAFNTNGHGLSYVWYLTTITDNSIQNGFYYSPLCDHGFHGLSIEAEKASLGKLQTAQAITNWNTFGNVTSIGSTNTIHENRNAGIYKNMTMPIGADQLEFRFRFQEAGDGDFLSVHWGENNLLYVGLDLPITRSSSLAASVPVSMYATQTNNLIFKLISRGETNAVLVIDSVALTINDDADYDGILNTTEITLGTDPRCYDTDGDGLSDSNEVYSIFSNPLLRDSDFDGMDDFEEVQAGTSPTNSSSVFLITNLRANTNDLLTVSWLGVTNRQYRVNSSLALGADTVYTLTNTLVGVVGTNTFEYVRGTNGVSFFWIETE